MGESAEDDGFTKQLTKSEKKKLRKVEKRKPRFQFDVGSFRTGRKIAINVCLASSTLVHPRTRSMLMLSISGS